MGIYGTHFHNLSREEKLVMADVEACKIEKERGQKMTPQEYEDFVWEFITNMNKPRFDN